MPRRLARRTWWCGESVPTTSMPGRMWPRSGRLVADALAGVVEGGDAEPGDVVTDAVVDFGGFGRRGRDQVVRSPPRCDPGPKTPAPISARVSKTRREDVVYQRQVDVGDDEPPADTESRPEAFASMSALGQRHRHRLPPHPAPTLRAAADVQGLAGHLRRFVCREEHYGIADVCRRPHPSRRDGLDEVSARRRPGRETAGCRRGRRRCSWR